MKKKYRKQKIDLATRRRKYYSVNSKTIFCPECNSKLIKESCTILLAIKSDTNEGEFMTNMNGSYFCTACPVVVFDKEKVEQGAKLSIREEKNVQYTIAGIVDFNSIPEEKKYLEIGTDENPAPLVEFLPDLNISTIIIGKKIGRNELFSCGSGKKYKKCCGR